MIAPAHNEALIRRYEQLRKEQNDLDRRAEEFDAELTKLEWMLPADYVFPGDPPRDFADDPDDAIAPNHLQRTIEDMIGFKLEGAPKPIIEHALHEALDKLAKRLRELTFGV